MLHQAVDRLERGIAEFTGEMRVDRRGAETGVPEGLLDEREGDARFEEMRGIAVAPMLSAT